MKHLQQAGVENQGLLMRTSEKNQRYPNGKLRDYYRIIHNSIEQNIPGVIVEHAFVDSKEDVEQFLKDASKIKKLAQAGKNPAYYKAAMSGNDRRADGSLIPGDALFVKEMSGISQSLDDMCPYVYENAWSPHLASRVEGNPVDLDVVRRGFLKAANDYEYITMEGSGGILCPLCFDERKIQLEDVIREFELSSILVADAGLGTINSVVLTAEYMKAHSLPIKGIIFNHYHPGNIMEEDNIAMCQYMTGLPVIAKVQDNAKDLDIDADVLAEFYDEVKIK